MPCSFKKSRCSSATPIFLTISSCRGVQTRFASENSTSSGALMMIRSRASRISSLPAMSRETFASMYSFVSSNRGFFVRTSWYLTAVPSFPSKKYARTGFSPILSSPPFLRNHPAAASSEGRLRRCPKSS